MKLKLKSPIQIQFSPEAQSAVRAVSEGVGRKARTFKAKVGSAKQAFKATTLDAPPKPDINTSVFLDC